VSSQQAEISAADRADAETIWDFHQMHHQQRPCEAAIGLGSRDLGVATFAAKLYHAGMFPVVVFSGANSPSTAERFPRGEAVHFSEHALELGVPASATVIEPAATNTGENITRSREALSQAGIHPASVLLISLPYMERRAYATSRRTWPEVEAICASEPLSLDEYVSKIGNAKLLIDILVGDLQRVIEYPALGYAVAQDVPPPVEAAYQRLLRTGHDTRLIGR
jgi:uncharacterized SAM-binding protein YcdF (DUF218 family)